MEKSIRKLRFERVSQNRLQRALDAIDSLENLSNKSNYDWEQEQIDEISILMSKVKHVMASFGSSTPKDRFDKLLKQDQIQHRLLRLSDHKLQNWLMNICVNMGKWHQLLWKQIQIL